MGYRTPPNAIRAFVPVSNTLSTSTTKETGENMKDAKETILSRDWWIAAGLRALKTIAQTLVMLIGTELVGILDLPWLDMLSMAATAGVLSLVTSLAGLPEVSEYKTNQEDR